MNLINGVKTAVVMQVVDPTMQGRVSVRFAAGAVSVTEWARVISGMRHTVAGQAPLEIGDEVVLAFEDGRPERPFVLGKL